MASIQKTVLVYVGKTVTFISGSTSTAALDVVALLIPILKVGDRVGI